MTRTIMALLWSRGWKWLLLAPLAGLALALALSTLDRVWAHSPHSRHVGYVNFALLIGLLMFYGTIVPQVFRTSTWLGATRRQFFSATVLFALTYWLAATVAAAALGAAQRFTGGWWAHITVMPGAGNSLLTAGAAAMQQIVAISAILLLHLAADRRWGETRAVLSLGAAGIVAMVLHVRPQVLFVGQNGANNHYLALWQLAVVCTLGAWLLLRRAPIR